MKVKVNLLVFGFFILGVLYFPNSQITENFFSNFGDVTELKLKNQSTIAKLYHPRILLTDSALNVLKTLSNADTLLQRYANDVISSANSALNAKLWAYNKDDLWMTTEMTRLNIIDLAMAYRWTKNEKYAIAAKKIILNAVNFPDWTPIPGFLQTSEMTCTIALGYDWLYNWLDQPSRTSIENAILKFGLNEYLLADVKRTWLTRAANNFGIANNTSMLVAAIAVGDVYPEMMHKIIKIAISDTHLPRSIMLYAPDGAWHEGLHYWVFATRYTTIGMEVLKSVLGTDHGLSNMAGFSNTGYFNIYTLGPNGERLHFADDYTNEKGDEPTRSLFWLGKRFNNPIFINEEHRRLKVYKADALNIAFYVPPQIEAGKRSLDRFFNGEVPVATFRSAWNDKQALFLGAKGGQNIFNHGHLDLGNFELESSGIRWAADLGTDNYDLPGYFANWKLNSAQRWTYYRCNSHSHNVPMINNKDQLVAGKSIVTAHEENINEPYVIFDLTSAYSSDASNVTREIKIIKRRKAVQVTDSFVLNSQADIYWGMTTPATIQILTNGEAILTKSGKTLKAKIVSPTGLNFFKESCAQAAPQASNFGYSRLMVKTKRPNGLTILKITLCPN